MRRRSENFPDYSREKKKGDLLNQTGDNRFSIKTLIYGVGFAFTIWVAQLWSPDEIHVFPAHLLYAKKDKPNCKLSHLN